MAELTDPTPAMTSFERAMLEGAIMPENAALYPDVVAYLDRTPNGATRFTYAQIAGRRVVAFANFIMVGHEAGLPVFQVGVAVPEIERTKGRAKHIIRAGIAEMKHGLGRAHPGAAFYVEAVVGLDNGASQRVSAAVISNQPTSITDSVSGLPALHYIQQIGPQEDDPITRTAS